MACGGLGWSMVVGGGPCKKKKEEEPGGEEAAAADGKQAWDGWLAGSGGRGRGARGAVAVSQILFLVCY